MTSWLNKEQMRRSFNAAATTYDQAADLQRDVANLLLKNIPDTKNKTIIDIGSGTGYLSKQLSDPVISIDISENMLRFSKQEQPDQTFFCSDAEQLSLCSEGIDIVVSSMALHWCQDIKKSFSEFSRILKPNGQLFFAIMGEASLHELQTSWKMIDSYQHVNYFPSKASIQNILETYFSKTTLKIQNITRYHNSIYTFMKKLKAIGAHNVTNEKPHGLTGKEKLRALEKAYEVYRNQEHMLPATYEIIIGVCEK